MRSKIFLIIAVVLFSLVLGSYLYFGITQKKLSPSTPQTSEVTKATISSVDPPLQNHLIPGTQQMFTLNFDKAIDLSSIKVDLNRLDLSQNKTPEPVVYTSSLFADKKVLRLTLTTDIQPYSEYSLKVVSIADKRLLLSTSYLTEKPVPTIIPINNPVLAQFLPHDTPTYTLSYLKERNVYLFSFKYSPGLGDINTQYDQAKEDALKFIQAKGVDSSTLTIDWK